ncbi:NAD(+) diphosphatase [Angustibacter aerolatus]
MTHPLHVTRGSDGPLGVLPLATSGVDRAGEQRDEQLLARLLGDPATQVLEVASGRTPAPLDAGHGLRWRPPAGGDLDRLAVYLGHDVAAGTDLVAVVADAPADDWVGLRELGQRLDPRDAGLLTEAVAVTNWHATHHHCPRCGAPTLPVQSGWVRRCSADGSDHYPRTDPAVIMTVVDDDDRLLLGSSARWPAGRYSTLAGFVEPGESLEATVRREVREEVGVEIGDVAYLGSQPWPFPASIMLGFVAQALTTEVHVDGEEIAAARWFTRDELAESVAAREVLLSPRLSISRALVEHWYGGRIDDGGDTWR